MIYYRAMRIEDEVKKLSTAEQSEFFKKLDIAENVLNFWAVVDESILRYKEAKKRRKCLEEWLEFLEAPHGSFLAIVKWNKITLFDIYGFREFLAKKPGARLNELRSETYIEYTVRVIKKISERLYNMGLLKRGDIVDVKIKEKVSKPNKAPRVNDSDIIKLLTSFDLEKLTGRRDRALIAALVGGALRISEAIKLKVKNIKKTDKGTIYLVLNFTKTGEDRLQPIYGDYGNILYAFAQEVKRIDDSDAGYIFRCFNEESKDEHLSNVAARVMFSRIAKKTGFPTTKTHTFRVTTITKLLENKMPLQDVQKFSGHASITTVQMYDRTKLTVDELAERIIENI